MDDESNIIILHWREDNEFKEEKDSIWENASPVIIIRLNCPDLADILLRDYRVTFESTLSGRAFEVSKPSTKSVFKYI